MRALNLRNTSLRLKTAILLVLASLLPLMLTAFFDIRAAREQLLTDMKGDIEARSSQFAHEIDAMNRGYRRSASVLAVAPAVRALWQDGGGADPARKAALKPLLAAFPANDSNVRGVAMVDAQGAVLAASNEALVGTDLSARSHVKKALQGGFVISDVHFGEAALGAQPLVAYVAPVRGANAQVLGLVALWVAAPGLWPAFKSPDVSLGPGSFALLMDRHGVRVANNSRQDAVFHPGGRLDPAEVAAMVAEQRFGSRTAALLADVKDYPEVFEHARAATPDPAVFYSRTANTGNLTFGVARRIETTDWTVFFMVTQDEIDAKTASMTSSRILVAGAVSVLALLVGWWAAAAILNPVRSLSAATAALQGGQLSTRVVAQGDDELGQLAKSFNAMAERIEAQATALQSARDDLELRVEERTGQLQRSDEARARMAAIVESSDDAIIGKALDGTILTWNAGAERVFGYGAEEAVGQPMTMLIPPERALEEPTILARIAKGERIDHFETQRLRKDGTLIDISATISPILDARGDVVGASNIARDVSASKRAEEHLQAQLERLGLLGQITRSIGERQDLKSIYQVVARSLEDQLPLDFACVCNYDALARTLTVTTVGVRSLELAMDLALDESAVFEVDENGLSACVGGALVHEADLREVDFPFPGRLLAAGLHSLVMAPLMAQSQVFGILVAARRKPRSFSSGDCEFIRQLSQHVALAAQQAETYGALQRAYDDLRQTQQSVMQHERLRVLGQMASGVAHDINNSLSPMTLYTEALLSQEPGLSERAREYLTTIERAIGDVSATVSRMREFYRDREAELPLQALSLNELVLQVAALTRARWSDMPLQRGVTITLVTELADGLPALMGVESELRQALINLVFNAVDAMPDGGTLTLRTRWSPGTEGTGPAAIARAWVEVSDSGAGMDESTRRRCLEPFFTTKGEQGTGLGLAMVYGIAQRHGAELDVRSAPGLGTTVSLEFRLAGEAAAAVSTSPSSTRPPPMRLLLIDDDPVLLKSLQDVLEADGHDVTALNGGQAGIDAFRAATERGQGFGAVITDLGMPYVDGRKVALAIKQASATTPVLLLTGWGQRLVADGEAPTHVDVVLSKPPRLRELREALARCHALRPGPV